MKTEQSYTAEIYDGDTFKTIHVSATPSAIMGTIYEMYPGCRIVRIY